MRAGAMRHRITIQAPSSEQTESGEPTGDWNDVLSCWAAVNPLTGREFYASQHREGRVTTEFRIRYPADEVDAIAPHQRVVWDGRYYDIQAVQLKNGLKHELVLMADEVPA